MFGAVWIRVKPIPVPSRSTKQRNYQSDNIFIFKRYYSGTWANYFYQ